MPTPTEAAILVPRFASLMRTTLPTLLLLWAILPAGCESRPQAPVLRDDPVYQNDREGFRFIAPDGWNQGMRGEVPPGKVDKERTLVDYRRTEGAAGASLRVSLIDLAASADLAAYLAEPSSGVQKWQPTAAPEETAVGSATGVRYAFVGRSGKDKLAREVVAVRKGERVYFFTALYRGTDTEVRDQLRRVVASVIWKK